MMKVRDRVFTSSREPPKSCFDYIDGTLVSHTDPDGGGARIDFIYYSHQQFIEATVGDYRTLKLPPIEDSVKKCCVYRKVKRLISNQAPMARGFG